MIKDILTSARVIAVVGMSNKSHRTSYSIGHYLKAQGYTVYPVNPMIEASGELKAYASLAEVPEPIDIVNIFRNAPDVPPVVEEAITVQAKTIWMQLGIVHEEAAQAAQDAGLQVVMDRCILVDHRNL